ncbi:unnamed protein product [Nesidiocoris tenuis]|uniref:Reverse transcriptase Ty1/copia-type domain-containing protein n=1 Tax=Nesidiocoris tenuis TaxID=355587 RepID=A0A6H5G460_9HEMI|nr:unnamed protein product [Nesidiocoris tenuis]
MEVDSQDSWIDANEAVLMEVSEDSGAEEEIDLQEINDLLDDEGPPQNHPSHSDSEPAPGPFSSEEVAVDEEGAYREDESDQSEHIPQLRDRSLLKTPNRFQASTNFAMSFVYEMEAAKTPETYRQALQSEDREHWKKAMDAEMKSLAKNETWIMQDLPPGKKAVACKYLPRQRSSAAFYRSWRKRSSLGVMPQMKKAIMWKKKILCQQKTRRMTLFWSLNHHLLGIFLWKKSRFLRRHLLGIFQCKKSRSNLPKTAKSAKGTTELSDDKITGAFQGEARFPSNITNAGFNLNLILATSELLHSSSVQVHHHRPNQKRKSTYPLAEEYQAQKDAAAAAALKP